MSVSGGLRGSVQPDGRGILFTGRGRERPLHYGGLVVRDARGRELPARLSMRRARVAITVDDRRAAYPVRVDPIVQIAKLTASDAAAGDNFGQAVAVSADGSTIVVGSRSAAGGGAAYVFTKPVGAFADSTQTAKLTASDGGGQLGGSVAVSADGSTVAAGAPAYDGGVGGVGAVYAYQRPGGGWTDATQTAKLSSSSNVSNLALGSGVSIAGDGATIVGGATGSALNPGARSLCSSDPAQPGPTASRRRG